MNSTVARVKEADLFEAFEFLDFGGGRELRGSLTGLLRQVRQGTSLLITSHDEVVAELHPPSALQSVGRQPGALRGKIEMASDFDILPSDILVSMENGEH